MTDAEAIEMRTLKLQLEQAYRYVHMLMDKHPDQDLVNHIHNTCLRTVHDPYFNAAWSLIGERHEG